MRKFSAPQALSAYYWSLFTHSLVGAWIVERIKRGSSLVNALGTCLSDVTNSLMR